MSCPKIKEYIWNGKRKISTNIEGWNTSQEGLWESKLLNDDIGVTEVALIKYMKIPSIKIQNAE